MFLNKGTEHICCFLKVSLRQKSFVAQFTFIFEEGGDDPGVGCRATDAVVARALPEFATRKVVNSNDIYPTAIYRYSSRPSQRLDVWKFSGRIRPSRIISPISISVRD